MSVAIGFAPNPVVGGGQGGGTFSPLTMFECTISSATMLIDSMAVRDLLIAFKIVAQLHGHLLEVLDPTVQRLVNVADEHSQCPPPLARATNSGGSSSLAAAVAGLAAAAAAAAGATPGTSKLEKAEPSSAAAAAAAAAFSVKSEANADSDDDCVLMEADLVFDGSGVGSFSQSPPAKAARLAGPGGGGAGDSGGELSNEWKATLRKAYRILKDDSGTNVFDFSLPYSARVNVQAANQVIDRALSLSRQPPANMSAWRMLAEKYFKIYFGATLKRDYKVQHQQRICNRVFHCYRKLNRRQKSYDALKPSLDEAARVKFESVLNRDYTSSDEEGGADLDSEMKVRSLPWESDELRDMKRRLDDVYLEQIADEKQRADAARLQRDPTVVSGRPPPADKLDWAKNPDWTAGPL